MGKVIHIDGNGGGGSGTAYLGVFDNYNALIAAYPTAPIMSLAYVQNSQGTPWLPGSLLGTFYSKGSYLFDGVNWVSSVDEISEELQNILDNMNTQDLNEVLVEGNVTSGNDIIVTDKSIVKSVFDSGGKIILDSDIKDPAFQKYNIPFVAQILEGRLSTIIAGSTMCYVMNGNQIFSFPIGQQIQVTGTTGGVNDGTFIVTAVQNLGGFGGTTEIQWAAMNSDINTIANGYLGRTYPAGEAWRVGSESLYMFESQVDTSTNYINSERYLEINAPIFMAFNSGLNASGDQSGLFVDNDQGFTSGMYTTVSAPVDLRGAIEIIKNNLIAHSTNYFGRDSLPISVASNSAFFNVGVVNAAAIAAFGAIVKTSDAVYVNKIAFNSGEGFETRVLRDAPSQDNEWTIQDRAVDKFAGVKDLPISKGLLIQNVITAATLTGNVDDWSPTGFNDETDLIRVDVDANNRAITGLVAPEIGLNRIVAIKNLNQSGNDLRFSNNNAGSLAENRFLCRDGNNKSIKPNEMALWFYDHIQQRWTPFNRIG